MGTCNFIDSCEKCSPEGRCCCNSESQKELFKHPWNKIHKGAISESTGMYACVNPTFIKNGGILFENKHGLCELHTFKEKQIKSKEDIISEFCKKIIQKKDCPSEFIEIVNKEFWNLI